MHGRLDRLGHGHEAKTSAEHLGRAVVVGCGLGQDAEFLASRGYRNTAFDVAPSAIAEIARRRPESEVSYHVADLLELPLEWSGAFDLVVEIQTLQSLPRRDRRRATAAVRQLLAAKGRLLVIAAFAHRIDESTDAIAGERSDGPPWPLTAADVDALSGDNLREVQRWLGPDPDDSDTLRWLVVLERA